MPLTEHEFLSKFKKLRKTGTNQYQACCPAHDDKTPSMAIKIGNNKVLMCCHAGCSSEQIVSSIGLKMCDLFFDEKVVPVGEKIEHRYTNENGQHIYSTFRQYYSNDTKKMWSMAAPGYTDEQKRDLMKRYIYNLPAVLESIKYDGRVYIVEGEKCCDALSPIVEPLAATCNPGGAGKWTDDHSKWFLYTIPAEVIIIPDNDESGQKHASEVMRSLKSVDPEIKVKIVNIPGLKKKGDIADWIKQHGNA